MGNVGKGKGLCIHQTLSLTTWTKYRYNFNRVLTWDLWTQSSPSQPFYQAQFRELFNRKLPGLTEPCSVLRRDPSQPPSTAKKLCKEHTNHEAGAYQSNLNPARARYGAGGGRPWYARWESPQFYFEPSTGRQYKAWLVYIVP